MRIRRIRLVLPQRLARDAAFAARLAGTELGATLERDGRVARSMTISVAGNGQPAAILARSIATAARTRGAS